MSDWIPVTERLPEMGWDVLFTGDMIGVQKGCLKTRKMTLEDTVWESNLGTELNRVTHWMPLPPKPEINTKLFSLSRDWDLCCGEYTLNCTIVPLPRVVDWLNSLPIKMMDERD